jgi:hypothetical protein
MSPFLDCRLYKFEPGAPGSCSLHPAVVAPGLEVVIQSGPLLLRGILACALLLVSVENAPYLPGGAWHPHTITNPLICQTFLPICGVYPTARQIYGSGQKVVFCGPTGAIHITSRFNRDYQQHATPPGREGMAMDTSMRRDGQAQASTGTRSTITRNVKLILGPTTLLVFVTWWYQ